MDATLERMAGSIASIMARLPEPLAQHWQKSLTKLHTSDEQGSNSEVLETYLTVLKSLEDFQGKVTLHQSLMEVDGQKILVDQVYLGVGQGWYVSRDGELAGIGHAGDESWQWRASNNLAAQLGDVVKALQSPEQSRILGITVDLLRGEQ